MPSHRITELRQVLRQASAGALEDAWVYLRDQPEIALESECLVLGAVEESAEYAASLGFPEEGLDTPSIEDCAHWAQSQLQPPTDELLLFAFRYYWRFDAFPSHPWAPDPPPADEVRASLALEFYRSLGPEREGTQCKQPTCPNGAIRHSVYCRVHHYEMIRGEQCPYRGEA